MPRICGLLFAVLIFTTAEAVCAIEVQEYLRARENAVMQTYVAGLGAGYFWSNAYLQTIKSARPLYCQNPKLSLGPANYVNILNSRLRELEQRGRRENNAPIEVVLLDGLQQTFPCK